jgi:hypothetical protein
MNLERLKERRKYNDEIRQRIDLVAADIVVSKSDILKVKARLRHYDLLQFAKEHHVSLDWLICGDPTGLARTIVAKRRPG